MKDFGKETKRQTIAWEKIFASHISNEEMVSRILKKKINSQESTVKEQSNYKKSQGHE